MKDRGRGSPSQSYWLFGRQEQVGTKNLPPTILTESVIVSKPWNIQIGMTSSRSVYVRLCCSYE
uniref:Uncharacterized protein n=1 Tax=Parascaris univalens TaxID=6257 RepID=A0A915CHT3_PARUN